jgi:hypothetical protein
VCSLGTQDLVKRNIRTLTAPPNGLSLVLAAYRRLIFFGPAQHKHSHFFTAQLQRFPSAASKSDPVWLQLRVLALIKIAITVSLMPDHQATPLG